MEKRPSRTGPSQQDANRRRPGLRALGATVPAVARRALGRRGFAEGGLLTEWASVVGAGIAAVCAPSKLSFPRRDSRCDGTLTLRVQPGQALVLQHLEPLLIERINGYFGYHAVARLRFRQAPMAARRAPRRRAARTLDPEHESRLAERLDGVGDEGLRGVLKRLGRAVGGDTSS